MTAPTGTLTDYGYQRLANLDMAVMRDRLAQALFTIEEVRNEAKAYRNNISDDPDDLRASLKEIMDECTAILEARL